MVECNAETKICTSLLDQAESGGETRRKSENVNLIRCLIAMGTRLGGPYGNRVRPDYLLTRVPRICLGCARLELPNYAADRMVGRACRQRRRSISGTNRTTSKPAFVKTRLAAMFSGRVRALAAGSFVLPSQKKV
jgi:hypothetical protein